MKKKSIAASLFASLLAIAPAALQAETDCCIPDYQPSTPLCDDACAIYPAFAGVELDCGWDVFAFGEYLYWAPLRFTSLIVASTVSGPTGTVRTELREKWGFRSGFRVGVGMMLPCFDHWVGTIDYTRYHHSFTTNYSAAPGATLATLRGGIPNTSSIYRFIGTKSGFHVDTVSMVVQRPLYVGQRVVFSPGFGLCWLTRDMKIAQNLTIAANGRIDRQRAHMDYQAIGPEARIEGSWLWCWGLRMIGTVDVAILYAYHTKVFQVVTPAVGPIATTKFSEKHILPFARSSTGFGWGDYFCCNRYHFDIAATFDLFFEASKVSPPSMSLMIGGGSTFLYGLTVRGQFDF